MLKKLPLPFSKVLFATLLCGAALQAAALEFRSIAEHGAVFYDAPGGKGKPLFAVSRGYPVEVLVGQKDWSRVRDQAGALAWVATKQLSAQRNIVVVRDKAEVHATADSNSAIVTRAEKSVILELLEQGKTGWIKVRHRDGAVGFVKVDEVWGV
ncbi:hypothetical protein KSF73_05925 [Burkholderiaceae bacterium DAT-1]|nr:hypothetical protein [Burkholderiaceae bacterium DAT-1]